MSRVTRYIGGGLTAIVVSMLVAACSDGFQTQPQGPSMFHDDVGVLIVASPSTIAADRPNTIFINTRPRYSGTGYAFVSGYGGGRPIGIIVSADSTEIGHAYIRTEFVADQVCRIELELQVYPGFESVGFGAQVCFDSLLVEGDLVSLDSEEARGEYTTDSGPSAYGHFVLPGD